MKVRRATLLNRQPTHTDILSLCKSTNGMGFNINPESFGYSVFEIKGFSVESTDKVRGGRLGIIIMTL